MEDGDNENPPPNTNGEGNMTFQSKVSQMVAAFTKGLTAAVQEEVASQLTGALKGRKVTAPGRVVGATKTPRTASEHLPAAILSTLETATEPMAASALYKLVRQGATEAQFGYALRGLKEEGKVVQHGNKRSAVYTLPGRPGPAPKVTETAVVETPEPTVEAPEAPAPVSEPEAPKAE